MNVPAYVIMQQKALMGIVNLLPDSPRALEAIPYFGAKGVERYGLEILGIIRKYMAENQLERPEITDMLISSGNSDDTVRATKDEASRKRQKKQEKEAEKEKRRRRRKIRSWLAMKCSVRE